MVEGLWSGFLLFCPMRVEVTTTRSSCLKGAYDADHDLQDGEVLIDVSFFSFFAQNDGQRMLEGNCRHCPSEGVCISLNRGGQDHQTSFNEQIESYDVGQV